MKQKDEIPVKIEIIMPIYEQLIPTYHKLKSIVGDIYSENLQCGDLDESTVLEFFSAACALKIIFEEYFEQAKEANVDQLYLSKIEFAAVLSLAKTVELSLRTPVLNTGLWTH